MYDYLKTFAELNKRSLAGQIEYWTKIGIATEKKFSHDEIQLLLNETKNLGI